MLTHTCNPGTWKVEAKASEVEVHPWVHGKGEVSLDGLRPCLQVKRTKKQIEIITRTHMQAWNVINHLPLTLQQLIQRSSVSRHPWPVSNQNWPSLSFPDLRHQPGERCLPTPSLQGHGGKPVAGPLQTSLNPWSFSSLLGSWIKRHSPFWEIFQTDSECLLFPGPQQPYRS